MPQPKSVDQRGERGWLLPSAWVVEKIPPERRAPVLHYPHERAAPEERCDVLLQREDQPDTVVCCLNQDLHVIDDQRTVDGGGE